LEFIGNNIGVKLMAIQIANKIQVVNYGNILQPASNFTVMCWFYNTDNSTYQMLFGREDAAGSQPGWHLEIDSSQRGGFHGDHGPSMVFTTATIALNTWYHMAGIRDSVAGNQRIYLNGSLANTATNLQTLETVTNEFQVGETLGWPGEGFVGIMDDIRVYDRVLLENEIATIYACRGCDSIDYGLQYRDYFMGPDNQDIGSFSTIAINNVQNTSSSSSGSSLTLSSYTAPTASNLVLVVAATAESTASGRVQATNITFNGNALTQRATTRTTTSAYNGVGIWSKSVTSGETGNIVVTWAGSNSRKTIFAYVLSNAQNVVDATATSFSNTGTTTTGLTTITNNTLVVTACANEDGSTMSAVGTNHSVNSTVAAGAHAGAIGNVPVSTAGAITGIGYTATTMNGSALALVAFRPVNNTTSIVELSNNEYSGTAINVPKYISTFLKTRRY
jgi:hypothetical protein